MEEIEFIYNQQVTRMQCKGEEYIKDIISRYKIKINTNNVYFTFNGTKLNENQKLNEIKSNNNEVPKILVIDTIQQSKDEYIESNNIICPQCNENCLIDIKDYKIKLYGCDNSHITDNILLNEFKNTQKINISNIKCSICNKSKLDTYKNELYICCECNINLCPLHKSNHNKEHTIINYDMKNYLCIKHGDKFISYCKICNKNLCNECGFVHNKEHNLIYQRDININMNNLINELNELKHKLEYILHNTQIIIDIYNNINKKDKNLNYQILQNKNLDLREILNMNEYINPIYDKMRTKAEIRLRYDKNENIRILGDKFVENNINNFEMIVNNKSMKLQTHYTPINNQIILRQINNITDLSYMFYECTNLLSISNIDKLNTNKVTDMSFMFDKCNSLESLPDISIWNANNVTNMKAMFQECSK